MTWPKYFKFCLSWKWSLPPVTIFKLNILPKCWISILWYCLCSQKCLNKDGVKDWKKTVQLKNILAFVAGFICSWSQWCIVKTQAGTYYQLLFLSPGTLSIQPLNVCLFKLSKCSVWKYCVSSSLSSEANREIFQSRELAYYAHFKFFSLDVREPTHRRIYMVVKFGFLVKKKKKFFKISYTAPPPSPPTKWRLI